MATFSLAQLKDKHSGATAKRVFALEDVKRQTALRSETEGSQFAETKPTSFLGKTGQFLSGIIGGKETARGLGQAIAAPEVQKTLITEQRETEALQSKLLSRIREKKQSGEDTTRLENALKKSQDLATTLSDAQGDFAGELVTGKQIAGSSLRLAGTLGAGLLTRTAAKAFALGKATSFGAGAIQGTKVGATAGGITGGIQGAGVGLEKEEDLAGVLKNASSGVVLGVLTGGALGAITGGVSGALKGRQIKKENFAKELVAPKETPKVKTEAIAQGRLKDPTFLQKAEIQFGRREEQLAKSVDDVVSSKATIGENIDAIRLKISNTNTGVKNYVKQNKVPFNTNQVMSRLESGNEDLRLIFASDKTAQRTYKAVVDEFMRNIKTKDTAGLLQARQDVDKIPAIKKLLETEGLGENTRREIVLAVRRAANEYVASLLPKGNTFRADLLQEHYMIESVWNLAEKTTSIIGKNKLQILSEEYPFMKTVIGAIVGGLAAGLGLKLAGGVGAGSSVIGSSD